MKTSANRHLGTVLVGLSVLALRPTQAQDASQVEGLKVQLQKLQADFERVQREQRQQIELLKQQIEALQMAQPAAAVPTGMVAQARAPAAVPKPATTLSAPAEKPAWSPTDPIRVGGNRSYVDFGASVDVAVGGSSASDVNALELEGHNPNQQGFSLQGVEMAITGAVDPYFRGDVNLTYSLNSQNDGSLELEEAWLETVSLPWNLKFRLGQVWTEFGRQNPTHLHAWSFVDSPLVNSRMLSYDGQRNPGAWLSWLMPIAFYSELLFSVQNSNGETAMSFRDGDSAYTAEERPGVPFTYREAANDRGVQHLSDMLFSARYATSFDLTDAQVLLAGLSGAFGPNSRGGPEAGDTRTSITGADLTWKWTSPKQHGGFPFVSWQTEGMLRFYDAGAFNWDLTGSGQAVPGEIVDPITGAPARLRTETLTDYGFYTQLVYGFRKGWAAGMRYDWVSSIEADYEKRDLVYEGAVLGRDPARAPRWRLSPNLTWYPTEFSKLRLQFNYDNRDVYSNAYSVWMQFEFVLGAHAAHKF